jgi:hypothetical protein
MKATNLIKDQELRLKDGANAIANVTRFLPESIAQQWDFWGCGIMKNILLIMPYEALR